MTQQVPVLALLCILLPALFGLGVLVSSLMQEPDHGKFDRDEIEDG